MITGAAKRLGRASAEILASAGVQVILHYHTSIKEVQDTAAALEQEFPGTVAGTIPWDLTDPEKAGRLIDLAIRQFGPIDILINSASIFPEDTFSTATVPSIQRNLDINAISPFVLGRALAAQGIQADIINFLDTRIVGPDPAHLSYHLSKRLFHSMTSIMAETLAPAVRVNAISPGLVLPPEGEDESYLERLRTTNPLNTYGDASDIQEAILFLVQSSFITGQVINIDGGRHLLGDRYGI